MMRICHRCGEQAEETWLVTIETCPVGKREHEGDFGQVFVLCEECRQALFDRLSNLIGNNE